MPIKLRSDYEQEKSLDNRLGLHFWGVYNCNDLYSLGRFFLINYSNIIRKTSAEQARIKLDLGKNKIEILIKMTSKNNK